MLGDRGKLDGGRERITIDTIEESYPLTPTVACIFLSLAWSNLMGIDADAEFELHFCLFNGLARERATELQSSLFTHYIPGGSD